MAGSTLRILIVGGCIAGLALARALRLAGFRPDVIEQRDTGPDAGPSRCGPGLFLFGNALRALRELDLDIPLRPLGEVIRRQHFLDTTGQPLCTVDLARFWGSVGQCRAVPRAELDQVFFTGVGGEVRHGSGVRDLTLLPDGIAVTFTDGQQAEYDLVVGADGRRSTVRTLAALGGAPRSTGHRVYHWVADGGPKINDWVSLLGHRSAFVVMPIGTRRLYCCAEVADEPERGDVSEHDADPIDPVTRMRTVFADYGGPVPELLDGVEQIWQTPADEVILGRWSRAGRVVLIGDAAHATSPGLAQGAALAIEDAVVLAAELCRAADPSEALTSYETRRRPRTRWVLDRTRDRDRTRNVPPALRDPLLRSRGERIFQEHYRLLLDPI